jgi:TolB-like protein/cytochrome c-type biogenesis protein CcmH/NrfG
MNEDPGRHGFFAELKRREVLSSAAYYFAVAWGGIEILEWVLERWQITPPEWVMPLLATALVVGFPVVMFLAWMFDVDKTGIHRTPPSGRKGWLTLSLSALLMLGGTAGLYLLIGSPDTPQRVLAPTLQPRFAILPLESFGGGDEARSFADGVHFELIRNFGQLSSLLCISRQSVMPYRNSDKTLQQIATELDVDAILTGAVQRMADRVRISLSLRDGRHDTQLWADDFDFAFTPEKFFNVQAEVAETVAGAFQLGLAEIEFEKIATAPTRSVSAFDEYMKGQLLLATDTSRDARAAEQHFREAIRLDPDYALAYVGLADAYMVQSRRGALQRDEANPTIESLVDKALELDDRLVEAWVMLGSIRWRLDRYGDAEVEAAFQRAIELNPNHARALAAYAYFLKVTRNDFETALSLFERARKLNPRSIHILTRTAEVLEELHRPAEAVPMLEKALEIEPRHSWARMMLGFLNLSTFMDYTEAWRQFLAVAGYDPEDSWSASMLSLIALNLNASEAGQAWAEEAWRRKPRSQFSCGAKLLVEFQAGSIRFEEGCTEILQDDLWYYAVFRDRYLATDQAGAARAYYMERVGHLLDEDRAFQGMDFRSAIDLYPVLLRTGERELANALLDRAEAFVQGHYRLSTGGYLWADVEIHALRGDTEQALAAMRSAIDEGLRWEWNFLDQYLNLQSLWDEPAFKGMLAGIAAEMDDRRAAVEAEFGSLMPGESGAATDAVAPSPRP